jgi:hypothetical protein
MKNMSLTFCLVIAALLASVGSGFAESDSLDFSGNLIGIGIGIGGTG